MESTEIDVTVVLPVYNEAGHALLEIDRIRAALDASQYTYEIIVVDDGSTDGSTEELQSVEGIRLIRFPENRGSGSARKIGSRAARGRVIVWTDADLTYPNERIPELVKELDHCDQVVGARTSEQGTAKAARVPREMAHPPPRELSGSKNPSPISTRGSARFALTSAASTSTSCPRGSRASRR